MSYSIKELNTYIGMKFNSLTVLSITDDYNPRNPAKRFAVCRCDCGREKVIRLDHVVNGDTSTCGCHNGKRNPVEHNLSRTRLYRIWDTMRHRCYNPTCEKYPIYGGRGIGICDEWKNDFLSFYLWANKNGYSDELSIDRIDNNKGYSPENCRFASDKQQCRNRRSNRLITYNGETKCLAQWCEELNLPYNVICIRINTLHWSIDDPEKLFFTPVRPHKRRKV